MNEVVVRYQQDMLAYGQYLATTGQGVLDEFAPVFSTAEQARVTEIMPLAAGTVLGCLQGVEERLRTEHPIAAALHARGPEAILDARYRCLSPADAAALNHLRQVAIVRHGARQAGLTPSTVTPLDWTRVDQWPDGVRPPRSPAIDEMRTLVNRAVERSRRRCRARGRELLENGEIA